MNTADQEPKRGGLSVDLPDALLASAAFSIIALALWRSRHPGGAVQNAPAQPVQAQPAQPDHARTLEAMKLLKEWITWLVTIETAAIGGIFVGLKDFTFEQSCRVAVPFYREFHCDIAARFVASGVFVAFGLAIMVAMYLLLALPALADRMHYVGPDFYFMRAVGKGPNLPIYLVRQGRALEFGVRLPPIGGAVASGHLDARVCLSDLYVALGLPVQRLRRFPTGRARRRFTPKR